MMTQGVCQYGILGIQKGMEGLRQNAAELASARQMDGSTARDITRPLVEEISNVHQVEASAQVFAAADEMIGRLIDVSA